MGTKADSGEEALEHYGILGMRWGVRRTQAQLDRAAGRRVEKGKPVTKTERVKRIKKQKAPPSEDAASAKEAAQKAKKGGVQSLSNRELQQLNTRLNLEQNYSNLTAKQTSPGKAFANEILTTVSKQATQKLANEASTIAVNALLKK
jgi:hypothetical protein